MESSIQYNVLLIFVLCLMCGFSQSGEVSLKIEPRSLKINPDKTHEAKVMCTLLDTSGRKVPLTACQYIFDGEQGIMDFSNGPASPQSSSGTYYGRYQGRGLPSGECGITLTGFSIRYIPIFGCRVRSSVVDSWIYEAMMIDANSDAPMQFHLQPRVTLATAGSDVTFNGAAEQELSRCYFHLRPASNTLDLYFDDGRASKEQHQSRYHGDGLEQKQCGITMMNVLPERSGFVRGWVYNSTSPRRSSADFVTLIVLTAPEAPPLLTVNTTGLLAPGSVLHATCVVKNSRPVAKLTWFLGDDVIRNDNINEAPLDSMWRWDHDLQTIEQHLEHVVTLHDNGKQLKCKASHVALASGSQDSTSHVVLGFTAPESPLLTDVRVSGNILQAKCISISQPVANISWFLDDNVVREDNINEAPLDSKWRGNPHLQTIEQHLKIGVTSSDNGSQLKCRASHVALASGSLDSRTHTLRFRASVNPCQPNPCGPNSVCRVNESLTLCSCQEHFIGSPPFCRPECSNNTDCTSLRACVDARCVDPCSSRSCGDGAQCHVAQHVAECKCIDDLIGDPLTRCVEDVEPNCGLRGRAPSRITQGQAAGVGEFPWHAGLYVQNNGTDVYFCGGTLIKRNFVVTAAHCVFSEQQMKVQNVTDVKVVLGKVYRDFKGDSQNQGLQVLGVESVYLPRKYRGSRVDFRYDIAVLKLTSHAKLTNVVKLACVEWDDLSEEEELSNGDKGTVAGWGLDNNHTAGPMALQWIDLPWIDQDTCYNATVYQAHKYLTNDKFCAGFLNEEKSVCKGDSGGGYMVLKNGRYYLRGVVSVHLSINPDPTVCAASRYTSFTSFADYSSWVNKIIGRKN